MRAFRGGHKKNGGYLLVMATSAAILPGCAAFPVVSGPHPAGTVVVNSDPQGALLTFEDKTQCTTPCAVPVLKEISVKVAKAGYRASTHLIRPTFRPQVTIPMTLSAPTIEVEETALPDL